MEENNTLFNGFKAAFTDVSLFFFEGEVTWRQQQKKAANTKIKHKVIIVDELAIGRLLAGHTKTTWSNIRTDLV